MYEMKWWVFWAMILHCKTTLGREQHYGMLLANYAHDA